MVLWAATLSGFAVALVAPALQRRARCLARWLLPLVPLALFAFLLSFVPSVSAGIERRESLEWSRGLSISFALRLDGLALLFSLLVTGVGALVVFYAGDHLRADVALGRFQAFTLAFMASMLGLLLADDFIALYVFWELTSITSFFLIGFRHERAEARAAALQALLVTAFGGLALLAAGILLEVARGTFHISELLAQGRHLAASGLEPAIVLLVLSAAFTKSAQLPFSWWLPRAMEAPTPATAYLHAAAMVKAGVYLVARLSPLLGGNALWREALLWVGGATFLVGALRSFRETHLKRVLAQSTVSALGLMIFLLGVGHGAAAVAALAYVVAHAAYKGALFLAAGAVDHETRNSELGRLSGLWRAMPFTSAAAGLAALSMAGLPPTLGFVGKELAMKAGLGSAAAVAVVVAGSALTFAIAVRVGVRPFALAPTEPAREAHEARPGSWLPPLVLGAAGCLLGLWPALASPLVTRGASDATGLEVDTHLSAVPEIGAPLALSGLAIAAGVLAYLAQRALSRPRYGLLPSRGYEWGLRALDVLARAQTRILQSGYLRYYVLIVLACLVGLSGHAALSRGVSVPIPSPAEARLYEIGLAAIVVAAAVSAVRSPSRLSAIASMGAAGYGIGLLFLLFGAPDLAMTQFVIETLTVIVFVFAFYHLPRFGVMSPAAVRARDALASIAVGAVMAALILGANAVLAGEKISGWFLEKSRPEGHGRNVVNVILTDFRALDTLGEITVLAVAGTAVFALLKLRPGAPP